MNATENSMVNQKASPISWFCYLMVMELQLILQLFYSFLAGMLVSGEYLWETKNVAQISFNSVNKMRHRVPRLISCSSN